MTDFIHEHPKDEPAAPSPAPAPEPPLDEKTGQKRVYGYIFILFIVAFSLLLWSYMMNQRSNDLVLSELRGNASAMQSTLDRNIELEQQVEALEAEVEALGNQAEALQNELDVQKMYLEEERDNGTKWGEQYMAVKDVNVALGYCEAGDYRSAAAQISAWDYDVEGRIREIHDSMHEEELKVYDPLEDFQTLMTALAGKDLVKWTGSRWERQSEKIEDLIQSGSNR